MASGDATPAATATGDSAAAAAAAASTVLHSVAQLPERYRGVLLDQFGVLHDGETPYPGAIEAVAALAARGCRLLIISNSSRRSAGALGNLARMGFPAEAFAGVVTSGEVTHRHLRDRPGPWWQQAVGRRCLHFTWAARGAISLEGLGLEVTQDPQQAEFILAHGTEALGVGADGSSVQPCSLGAMRALLGRCAACGGLPMIVANPDVVTVSGSELRTMPGTLARHYKQLGGEVVLMGKPAAVIYEAALAMLDLPADQVVAIGDSLEHDIGGAQAAGVASVFVLGGIHAGDVALQQQAGSPSGYTFCGERLAAACESHDVAAPEFVLPYFR
ncbi:Haloacid dehalogenase-like hydrolase superfamily isoform 1 [Micractinium conductrix]|uniref:Haloacid dehalogenase-like hydrolase superfamily isoform 1 n=1 Tax=Micractinium conductrix TaxID=554055 RepID=A0A2P6V4L7_9CHLO|nr:Haloacid dehalogenase-like hydrolase superfamily isoform 1 [Micractinium conductrix]|eukprot:PSC69035.1 Haloacid dehalogenase-like hydrolase superfamily isoform 1 [Micractinium conductrix]